MKKSKFFVRRTINIPAAHNRPIAALPPPRFVNSEIPRLILANNSSRNNREESQLKNKLKSTKK